MSYIDFFYKTYFCENNTTVLDIFDIEEKRSFDYSINNVTIIRTVHTIYCQGKEKVNKYKYVVVY